LNPDILFEIQTPLTVTVRTTKEYWNYLVNIKHRVMKNRTAYPTDKVKEGDVIWTK